MQAERKSLGQGEKKEREKRQEREKRARESKRKREKGKRKERETKIGDTKGLLSLNLSFINMKNPV